MPSPAAIDASEPPPVLPPFSARPMPPAISWARRKSFSDAFVRSIGGVELSTGGGDVTVDLGGEEAVLDLAKLALGLKEVEESELAGAESVVDGLEGLPGGRQQLLLQGQSFGPAVGKILCRGAQGRGAGEGGLVLELPGLFEPGTGCGGANPCSVGWYIVGGTSAGAPQ